MPHFTQRSVKQKVHDDNLAQRRPSFVNKFPTRPVGKKSLSFSAWAILSNERSLANYLQFLNILTKKFCTNGQNFLNSIFG